MQGVRNALIERSGVAADLGLIGGASLVIRLCFSLRLDCGANAAVEITR